MPADLAAHLTDQGTYGFSELVELSRRSYHRERETWNVVIPSAARNLLASAARCFASLSMTFNHFCSH
jgi:hypothetical protein